MFSLASSTCRAASSSSSSPSSFVVLRSFSTSLPSLMPRQVQPLPFDRPFPPSSPLAPPPGHRPPTPFRVANSPRETRLGYEPIPASTSTTYKPTDTSIPRADTIRDAYPSALNAEPKVYSKPQRREWNGPEDDYAASPATHARNGDDMVVNMDSMTAKSLRLKGDEKPAEVFVERSNALKLLPVYQNYTAGRQPLTVVRKVQGNSYALLTPLLRHLAKIRPDLKGGVTGRVNPHSGNLEIKGALKTQVENYLLKQGF